jgi:RNA polymerase sigma-70 factor (ECF subfamily)
LKAEVEAQIGRQLDAGDLSGAATTIVRGYGSETLSYLTAVSRDPCLAEEVFSAITEDLWRGLPGFRRECSARTWLYRLAYNALQRQRSDPFRRRQRAISRELQQVADEVRSKTAPFLRTEVKDGVARLREQLSRAEQTLLILRVDRNLSWREVGVIMAEGDTPLGEATLAKRFQRVKDKLRRLAAEAGLLPLDEP